jgi:hypothetical protein
VARDGGTVAAKNRPVRPPPSAQHGTPDTAGSLWDTGLLPEASASTAVIDPAEKLAQDVPTDDLLARQLRQLQVVDKSDDKVCGPWNNFTSSRSRKSLDSIQTYTMSLAHTIANVETQE